MTRTAILLATTLALTAADRAADAAIDDEARVVRGLETAMIRRYPASPWRKVAANGHIPSLADLRCDDGCTVQVDHDNTVEMAPNAIIAVSDYFYVPLDPKDGKKLFATHRILLQDGLIEATASGRGLPLSVTVGTNEHVALRSARVQLMHKQDRTAVAVIEGSARAGATHHWITLEAKQGTILVPHEWPRNPSPTVESPKWATSTCGTAPLGISNEGHEALIGACWGSVNKSAAYQVEVARDPEFHDRIGPMESVTAQSWSKLLGAGRYFMRVRAIDADGLTSELSPVRKLAVVPLMLPPGSFADSAHGAVVLPEGRDLSFGDAQGLDVAIDDGGFLRAPGALRMDGAPSHQLRIRLSDDPSSVSTVHIMRRALRADVRITPKTAKWPGDPIQIAVTIEDPTGLAQTDKVEPQIHALLGLTEVPLRWTHQGSTWSARVEPRRMGGPVVLRVIANDEHGTMLGRNFVEIDGPREQGDTDAPRAFRAAQR
ncbi:MAG TPA: hypothetical protein VGL13_06020 [Polyangiaceae bacterium]